MSRREDVTFEWERGTLSGVWHHPERGGRAALLLTHGAGGNLHMKPLAAFCDGLAARGIAAARFNLPYAEAGRRSPGRPAEAEAGWRGAIESARARAGRIFAGGKSYGGRMASHVAAQGTALDGLVFLGYPLHAPATPGTLRDAHLPQIAAPMLFLQGTRDAFARWESIARVVDSLGAIATLHPVEGGDHSFKTPGRGAADVVAELVDVTASWIDDR